MVDHPDLRENWERSGTGTDAVIYSFHPPRRTDYFVPVGFPVANLVRFADSDDVDKPWRIIIATPDLGEPIINEDTNCLRTAMHVVESWWHYMGRHWLPEKQQVDEHEAPRPKP